MMSTGRQVWNGKYEIVKSTGGTIKICFGGAFSVRLPTCNMWTVLS